MISFFDWLLTVLLGKKWVLHKMRQDYKTGILIKEMDLEYQTSRAEEKQRALLKLRQNLDDLQSTPLPEAKDHLSPEELEKPNLVYNFDRDAKKAREERVKSLENRIKVAEQEVAMIDGEVSRLNAENYKMRTKWDFVRSYQIKSTYVDYSGNT